MASETGDAMHIRLLRETDRSSVMELIDRDRIMGSLVHSFIVRRGLESSQEFWGLFGGADGSTAGAGAGTGGGSGQLEGLFTLDPEGRSTVLGGEPRHAGLMADFLGARVAGGAHLNFIDAPRELARALAGLLPPTQTESLGVWAHDGKGRELPPYPGGLVIRPVDPAGDASGLQGLYEADETFREIGVHIDDAMDAVRRGLRLMLVGSLGPAGEIVSAAFGWLTDEHVARVSGVVTHPDWRGRGYATAVVGELTKQLLDGGRRPFLYVSLENTPAVRVYERLGYLPHAVMDKLRYGSVRY